MPAIVSVDLIEIAVSEGSSPLGTASNCLCMHTHVRHREWIVGYTETEIGLVANFRVARHSTRVVPRPGLRCISLFIVVFPEHDDVFVQRQLVYA